LLTGSDEVAEAGPYIGGVRRASNKPHRRGTEISKCGLIADSSRNVRQIIFGDTR
jgi:hypothetical protein